MYKCIAISTKQVIDLYLTASPEWKITLENMFGKAFFSMKITDRVKSFEDACDITDEDANDEKFATGTPDEIAFKKLKVIVKALNEGWVPDWNNGNQRKYAPWFYHNKPGFRFFDSFCDSAFTYSTGGSRFYLPSKELSDYIGRQFIELYQQLLQ